MSRINVDVVGIGVDDILILSYYVVDDNIDVNTLLKIMMIDNNITSRTSDNLNI